jgi:hypothetical protein
MPLRFAEAAFFVHGYMLNRHRAAPLDPYDLLTIYELLLIILPDGTIATPRSTPQMGRFKP